MTRVFLALSGFLLGLLSPQSASALGPILLGCLGLPDCGRGPANVFVSAIFALFAVLMTIAAGVTVVFVVAAGFLLLFTLGDEGKVTKAKFAILYALSGFGIALIAASFVSFIATEYFGQGSGAGVLVAFMASAVRIMVLLFNALFFLMVIVAGIRLAMSQGKTEEFTKGTSMIKAAIVGAIVVNVARAVVLAFLRLGL